jgi:translation elongation factor EF-4
MKKKYKCYSYDITRKNKLKKKRESGWNSDGVKETKTRETLE